MTRESIEVALRRIEDELAAGALPADFGRNKATKYQLIHNGRPYPPKLVVAYALQHIGIEASTQQLSGGDHVNAPLLRHGFTIRAKNEDGP